MNPARGAPPGPRKGLSPPTDEQGRPLLFTTLLSAGVADRPAARKEAAVATASLPQDPDLDQLRKQARELQRAVRGRQRPPSPASPGGPQNRKRQSGSR